MGPVSLLLMPGHLHRLQPQCAVHLQGTRGFDLPTQATPQTKETDELLIEKLSANNAFGYETFEQDHILPTGLCRNDEATLEGLRLTTDAPQMNISLFLSKLRFKRCDCLVGAKGATAAAPQA